MKKIVAILSVVILIFSFVGVENTKAAATTYVVTPEIGVKLRLEPKEDSKSLTSLKQGTRVNEVEKFGEWIKVSYEGQQGYIKSEYLKTLDINELLAAYKSYATLLESRYGDRFYSLLYDFTQDGIEELYIVEFDDMYSGLIHSMFSGQKELFNEPIASETFSILWDDYNYYLVAEHLYFNNEEIKLSDYGIFSQHKIMDAEIAYQSYTVIRSGNSSINKIEANWKSIMSYDTSVYNDIEDSSGGTIFYVEGEKVTEEQFNKLVPNFENIPNGIYLSIEDSDELDDYSYSSSYEETVDKLYNLYATYNNLPIELPVDEKIISNIEDYNTYLQRENEFILKDDSISDINNSTVDYLKLFNMALYYNQEFIEQYDDNGENKFKYPKSVIDAWTYDNFGVNMDNQKLQEFIKMYDELAAYKSDIDWSYQKSIEIQDEYYITTYGSGDLGLGNATYIYDSHQLENDYIALEYVYGYWKKLSIINQEPSYIIVKKVESDNGKIYYPYIDTVHSLENLDYYALNNYAEMLDVVKDNKKIEPIKNIEAQKSAGENQEKTSNIIYYSMAIIAVIVLIVVAFALISKKKK